MKPIPGCQYNVTWRFQVFGPGNPRSFHFETPCSWLMTTTSLTVRWWHHQYRTPKGQMSFSGYLDVRLNCAGTVVVRDPHSSTCIRGNGCRVGHILLSVRTLLIFLFLFSTSTFKPHDAVLTALQKKLFHHECTGDRLGGCGVVSRTIVLKRTQKLYMSSCPPLWPLVFWGQNWFHLSSGVFNPWLPRHIWLLI